MVVLNRDGEELADFSKENIHNNYIARVAPGKHSLVIPLGSKAQLDITDYSLNSLPKGNYKLILTDISGITWEQNIAY